MNLFFNVGFAFLLPTAKNYNIKWAKIHRTGHPAGLGWGYHYSWLARLQQIMGKT